MSFILTLVDSTETNLLCIFSINIEFGLFIFSINIEFIYFVDITKHVWREKLDQEERERLEEEERRNQSVVLTKSDGGEVSLNSTFKLFKQRISIRGYDRASFFEMTMNKYIAKLSEHLFLCHIWTNLHK